MQDSGLKTAITKLCLLMKKPSNNTKVLQLNEEEMKQASDDQIK